MALGKKPVQIVEEGEYPLLAKADHWKRIPLAHVAKVQNGFAFSSSQFTKDDGLPLIRIRDIDNDTTENKYKGEFDKEYVVKKDDILVGMDGDFHATRWNGPKGLLNQRVCRIIPTSPSFSRLLKNV
jgi:type I restriction enzyme S subunit